MYLFAICGYLSVYGSYKFIISWKLCEFCTNRLEGAKLYGSLLKSEINASTLHKKLTDVECVCSGSYTNRLAVKEPEVWLAQQQTFAARLYPQQLPPVRLFQEPFNIVFGSLSRVLNMSLPFRSACPNRVSSLDGVSDGLWLQFNFWGRNVALILISSNIFSPPVKF